MNGVAISRTTRSAVGFALPIKPNWRQDMKESPLPKSPIRFYEELQATTVAAPFAEVRHESQVTTIAIDSSQVAATTANEPDAWGKFDSLFGAWADIENFDDDWMDKLRTNWDDRLADIYGTDW